MLTEQGQGEQNIWGDLQMGQKPTVLLTTLKTVQLYPSNTNSVAWQ